MKIKTKICNAIKRFVYFLLINLIQFGIETHYTYSSYKLFFLSPNDNNGIKTFSGMEIFQFFALTLLPAIIGLITQFICGLLIDYIQSLWGRRRKIMLIGLFIWFIGQISSICTTISPSMDNMKDQEIDKKNMWILLYGISNCIAFIGINIIQISYRAFVLDSFDWIHQNQVYIMASFNTGFARVVHFTVATIVTFHLGELSSENMKQYSIYYMTIQFGALVILPICVLVFCIVGKEQQQVNTPITVKEYLIETKSSFKLFNWRILLLCSVVFFGWISYLPFETRMTKYLDRYVMKDEQYQKTFISNHQNDEYSINLICLIYAISMMIVSIILYCINTRLDVTISISFLLLTITSIIFYILPFENYFEETYRKSPDSNVLDRRLSLIPYFISSLIYCHLNCLPYAMLRSVVQTNKFGFFLGIINCFLTFAQICSSLMLLTMEIVGANQSTDPSGYFMIFVCPFAVISVVVSFILFWTYRNIPKLNQRPYFESFETSQLLEDSLRVGSIGNYGNVENENK